MLQTDSDEDRGDGGDIIAILQKLHWLNFCFSIQFKVLFITFKSYTVRKFKRSLREEAPKTKWEVKKEMVLFCVHTGQILLNINKQSRDLNRQVDLYGKRWSVFVRRSG